MKSFAWIVAGLIAGLLGAAIWGAVTYFSGWEIGWIAWLIGGLVGIAVASTANEEIGFATGFGAACIATASICGGKYAVTKLTFDDYWEQEVAASIPTDIDEEMLVSWLAKQLSDEREAAGETLEWPDYDPDDPDVSLAETYPSEIWADAKARWDNADETYKARHREYVQAERDNSIRQFKADVVEQGFMESFTLWDLLWFGLAIATAWQIGSGSSSD